MIFAQIPGAEEAIKQASESGYEAVLMVVMMVALVGSITYLGKFFVSRATEREDKATAKAMEREDRMATRIDTLEDVIRNRDTEYQKTLVKLVSEVTSAITRAASVQDEMRATLDLVREVMGEVNGDIKELCQLLKVCPCLLAPGGRESYKVIDAAGDEVKLEHFHIQQKKQDQPPTGGEKQ